MTVVICPYENEHWGIIFKNGDTSQLIVTRPCGRQLPEP